jgi:hypothetical protein
MATCFMFELAWQEDYLKGEEGRPQGEQRPLPRPPPEMRQALPTDPQAISAFNDSMAAYYHQVACLATKPSINFLLTVDPKATLG